jgi:hypothetical protein
VSVVVPSTETSDKQSNYSPSAVRNIWFSKAHKIGNEQLPWPMPYKSLSIVLLYDACSSLAQSGPYIRTAFFEYPILRSAAKAMALTMRL